MLGDGGAAAALAAWMRDGGNPVLRVNAAGILAKLCVPSVTENVIKSLHDDDEARHLYFTAVANRVLRLPWDHAAERVAVAADGRRGRDRMTGDQAARLAIEARDGRDGVARWCSSVILQAG